MLNDFYKVLELEESVFDDIKGEADTPCRTDSGIKR